MRKTLQKSILPIALLGSVAVSAQTRYLEEVFSDADITVTSDVTYGTNIDFMRTNTSAPSSQLGAELTEIGTAMAMGNPIPMKYYVTNSSSTAPGDSTAIKVIDLKMDVYAPSSSVDTVMERPVMVYIHTGNFLPPPLNGGPTGTKTDLTAVELCRQWAKRGYVAVAPAYRHGWNPISSSAAVRRGTLLNAVYRAIHDIKQSVRVLRADAGSANTYGIDESKIVLYGQGSGGYVALAYATLDKTAEINIPKFLDPSTNQSYVNTQIVGDLDGTGGMFNLYSNPNNISTDVAMSINCGGALADTSWLEAGDVPMLTIQCVRDPFAPFGHGTVIVPTTGEQVVDVQGANVFMNKANMLGNNAAFANKPWNDPYTTRARAVYGQTMSYILPPPNNNITVGTNVEGVFPIVLPLVTASQAPLMNQGSPWEWWDPSSPYATAVINPGPPAVTAHQASLLSNPDMSETKGKTYIDTIQGYIHPRIMTALQLPGYQTIGMEEVTSIQYSVYPVPAKDIINVELGNGETAQSVSIMDLSGRVVMTESIDGRSRVELNVSKLNSGIYLLSVTNGASSSVQKIVIE